MQAAVGLDFRVLLTETTYRMVSVGECFAHQDRAQTHGDSMRPVVFAGDIPVFWKPPIGPRSLTPTDPNII
jgi:hypothetical protein